MVPGPSSQLVLHPPLPGLEKAEKVTQLTKAHVYFARNGGLAAPTFWPWGDVITQTTSSLICPSGYESKDSWKVPGHDSEPSVTLPLRAKESSCLGHTLGPGKEMKGLARVLPQEWLQNPRNTHPGSVGSSSPMQGALGLQVERTDWVGKGQKPGLRAQK